MCGSRGVIDGRKGKDAFPPRVPFQKAASCPLREEIKLSRDVFSLSHARTEEKRRRKNGTGLDRDQQRDKSSTLSYWTARVTISVCAAANQTPSCNRAPSI